MTDLVTRIRATVRDVPDFPRPGILFKDITPLLGDAQLFRDITDAIAAPWARAGITHVAAIESRGFLLGSPVAQRLGAALVPVRKPGKLPAAAVRESYALEYGSDTLEMHADAMPAGARVLVVDDVLATGGTAAAACALVERVDALVQGVGLLLELGALNGRSRLADRRITTLVTF
ncbi:MAG: adenine phosphoribosyltransferase [Gemmatimonadetes bacterium]|nr:adenine phosphoribosyltransferase [Gemmatimonadota bacterium]